MISDFSGQLPRIGYYNAGHDEALYGGIANFTPSRTAQAVERDLALLAYWGMECDAAVVPDVEMCEAFLSGHPMLRRPTALVSKFGDLKNGVVVAWGTDRAVESAARKAGLAIAPQLSNAAMVERMQNRKFSSEFLTHILYALHGNPKLRRLSFAGESDFAASVAEIDKILRRGGRYVVKRALSGSGRGIMQAEGQLSKSAAAWAEASCRKAHGVEVQRYEERVMDFALEFRHDAGKPFEFLGYSEFATGTGGGYAGNFLSQGSRRGEEIWEMLGASPAERREFEITVTQTLNARAACYTGPLGIDMMVCRKGNGLAVFPCVEMNFRHTMGMMANSLGIMPDQGSVAWFKIMSSPQKGELLRQTRAMLRQNPAVKSASHPGDERFLEGYLPLTPVDEDTQFHACVIFERDTDRNFHSNRRNSTPP